MADQNEFPLDGETPESRKSARHLPKYFRTEKNKKFLQATLDQMLQPGVTEKINSFVGRKTAKAYDSTTDNYLRDVSVDRETYQLEPVSYIKDNLDNILYYTDYRDYYNQIKNLGGVNSNHSVNSQQEFYSWDPHVDWDKLTNFREYYWLPNGPETVVIPGDQKEITSTFSLDLQEAAGDFSYVFTPDGLTPNPVLKLYRGVKYRIDVNADGLPITFRTARDLDPAFLIEEITTGIEQGVLEFTLAPDIPDEIFYVASNNINVGGIIKVANQEESTFIDVEAEIIGKKFYTTRDNWSLTNGLKVRFSGDVQPAKYQNSEWYVEGVGKRIQLVSESDVEISFPVGIDKTMSFDEGGFDRNPFGSATGFPEDKDYITINRASSDGNFWSRYNRWFHKDVIELSSQINGTVLEIDQTGRANRPIIEFDSGLKLYNFGTKNKRVVDLIDDFTEDAFSTIEGSLGYNVDGVQLQSGQRVLFLNDKDPLVKGKIFEVDFINFKGSGTTGQITLKETADSNPIVGENVLVVNGDTQGGKLYYYNGTEWVIAQTKSSVNQAPVFDVFDENGNSYSDPAIYPANNFRGTKIFSFAVGTGSNDSVLGFPLKYKSIENVGDIVFDFNFTKDEIHYQIDDIEYAKSVNSGFLRQYENLGNQYQDLGVYIKANDLSKQYVILQYTNDNTITKFPIDCYSQSGRLNNIEVKVFVNNVLKYENVDYTFSTNGSNIKEVEFTYTLPENANIVLKTYCNEPKIDGKGYYEVPHNLERNPLNNNIESFTLGEVTDHVASIIENTSDFTGIFPGPSNMRDIDQLSKNGTKFVMHSMPLNLPMYSLVDKETSLPNSIRYSKREYSKFKRQFIETIDTLGFEGPVKQHVDEILKSINKDKNKSMPFYFSDMIPYGASFTTNITIEDQDAEFYSLNTPFQLNNLSSRAVTIYLNGAQLTHEKDYIFNDEGYVKITANKQFGDVLQINEYESTNGSYIPATPTKLGLYPAYEPKFYTDTSYTSKPNIIIGHDGSKILAYNDFRDDLILELERRIYNNIKVKYNKDLFNIHDYIPGIGRTTGFSRADVYKPMVTDFLQWIGIINEDYTEHKYFVENDSFTYNYSGMLDKNGEVLPGFWKGIYQHYYDTETPQLTPWEMLGFSVQPTWWETTYGPAPYTKNNAILWEDLEKGIIREPGVPYKIEKKYARPNLTKFIPVDSFGNLLAPSNCNITQGFDDYAIDALFKFGDCGPVESAWKNSSEYAFAILASWAINNPARLLATGFDRSRQIRNQLGNIVYTPNNSFFRLEDIVVPNTIEDSQRVYTSGIINYIADYLTSNITTRIKSYESSLKNIKNSLGFRLAGFTDKDKFKLILDSRTPLNKGNVFIPEENYQISLNTSTAVNVLSYSGVIIEKLSSGYSIRGYDKESPEFNYYEYLENNKDISVNIGGVAEPFLNYTEGQKYIKDNIVEFSDNYYRVGETFTSTGFALDKDKLFPLAKLPVNGGTTALFRNKFDKSEVKTLSYGSILPDVQAVADFLLGYAEYLKDIGFVFDNFDTENEIIVDWKTSTKEFMFWSLQNWQSGSLIALSPAADVLKINTNYACVDNVYNNFYNYSILKADGRKITNEDLSISRTNKNEFRIETRNNVGLYSIKIPLVQKEHVVLIDNLSVFGDVIYEPATGYRQDRIKVFGYRSTEWDGTFNIPGFIYTQSNATEWEQWKDYFLGEIVKFKEFYYVANSKVSGKATFDFSDWTRLTQTPESGLLTNFEYKTNQFADYYDLDTDNFDIEQQKFAQHLIGYQNRQYLENIINDDVSQYKFYQGMIQEKGSKNALNKLFDVLSSADKESLEFFEEWAIKQGQYGASESFDEIELELDELKYMSEPQAFKLGNSDVLDSSIYGVKNHEVYRKPKNYTGNPFPTLNNDVNYLRSAGYVNLEDVKISVDNYYDITNLDITSLSKDDYVWVGFRNFDWDVLRYDITGSKITNIKTASSDLDIGEQSAVLEVTCTDSVTDVSVGDIIGIDTVTQELPLADDSSYPISQQVTINTADGFWKVIQKDNNKLFLESNRAIEEISNCDGLIKKFVSVRAKDFLEANKITQSELALKTSIWIDNNNDYKVLKNNNPYNLLSTLENVETETDQEFGFSITTDNDNRNLIVSNPSSGIDGKVFLFSRGSDNTDLLYSQVIEPSRFTASDNKRFGEGLALTRDGKYLIVGAPGASNVRSRFLGNYDPTADYQNGDIIQYADQLWEVLVDIIGARESQEFTSFGSIIEVLQKNNILAFEETFNNLLMGNYPFEGEDLEEGVDHILVRAPADQYVATGPGDVVYLDWYLTSTVNQFDPLTPRQPFNGQNPGFTESTLEGGLPIVRKVDAVIYIDSVFTIPEVGAQIDFTGTDGGEAFGYVAYYYYKDGKATIYVENKSGTIPRSGSCVLETGQSVGSYNLVAPRESLDTTDDLGGFWQFNIPNTQVVENEDQGRQLAVYNIVPAGQANSNSAGSNIWDLNNTNATIGANAVNSFYSILTYQGVPGPAGATGIQKSNKFVVRAPKTLTDILTVGETVNLEFLKFRQIDPNNPGSQVNNDPYVDVEETGLFYSELNKGHTLVDLWDGYIEFSLDATDSVSGRPFEPKVGQLLEEVNGTGATAQVAFWQKYNNAYGRAYLKNVNGTWGIGNDGRSVRWLAIPDDPDPNYRGPLELGPILEVSLGSQNYDPTLNIGKLCVFEADREIFNVEIDVEVVPPVTQIVGSEYLVYKDSTLFGIPTQPNIPSANNFNYKQVFKIPVDLDGPEIALNNFGYFTIYQRRNIGNLVEIGSFLVPDRIDGLRIGSNVKFAQNGDFYKAFIGCEGNGTINNPGKIYFINKGTDEEGIEYDWELARDKRYKGVFASDRPYFVGDLIFYEGYFYRSLTNVAGDGTDFIPTEWEVSTNDEVRSIDYLGYVPNSTGYVPEDFDYKGLYDSSQNYIADNIVQYLDGNFYKALRPIPRLYTGFVDVNGTIEYPELDWEQINFIPGGDSSLALDQKNLIKFARDFDVSDNAEVLIATADYGNTAILNATLNAGQIAQVEITNGGRGYRTAPKVTVLRKGVTHIDYTDAEVSVTIDANGTINSVSIDNAGSDYTDLELVVEPVEVKTKVVIYRNTNGNYLKTQELVSTEAGIDFGYAISISQDGKSIAVGAPNGDTDFGEERGCVYVYKQINGVFELSQKLQSTNPIRGEGFGYNIDFDGQTLYVTASNGNSDDFSIFDKGTTTFDKGFTYFKNYIGQNGVVYAYDNINDTFVFGQTIDYHTYLDRDNINEADYFGRQIVGSNNHLFVVMQNYVTASNKKGMLLDYRRNKSQRLFDTAREKTPTVDLSRIKQVMLYDKEKNVIVNNLDYIDPNQGKIAGIAEQEIRYKSPIDPAMYTNGTVNQSINNNWGQEHVGEVWWDLTNAKFLDVYQGNLIYKTNNFNQLAPGGAINVYEWVESEYSPEQYDELSNSADGDVLGISGNTKYGASVYSVRRYFDSVSQTFTTKYYYWVENKITIPNNTYRTTSIATVKSLIEDPVGQKYKFIALFDDSSFAVYNCQNIINDKDIILNIQYWLNSNTKQNIHNQYKIMTEGFASSSAGADIEAKWYDSLIGYDIKTRSVPDLRLSPKDRYGIFNNPRQSMFVNRTEALKQVVERVNNIFSENLITQEKNISKLQTNEPKPSLVSGEYDFVVNGAVDLEFVNVVQVRQPILNPIVEEGKIVRVDIVDAGRGYQVSPTYTIQGQGSDAEISIELDSLGSISNVSIINGGYNYNESTTIEIRKFSVLVDADEQINGRWAIYERNNNQWQRIKSQSYNTTLFWDYVDWYAAGYSEFTEVSFIVDYSYSLQGLNDSIGDVVKVLDISGSGWLLLEKVDNQDTIDYTVNYKTIGKQNGTIKLKDSLYDTMNNRLGFDTQSFDTSFFDIQPIQETRFILEALRDDILVDNLADEYNKLFFSSLKYVFAEQGYVDWAFKTSFVKAIHNVGELKQTATFKNDNLESYEEYIKEVKPYKSTIREYVSSYEKTDQSSSVISDFDSPPRFNSETGTISANDSKVVNGILRVGTIESTLNTLDKYWLENSTYSVTEIRIADAGSGYLEAPKIIIDDDTTALASLGPGGKISKVKVVSTKQKYYIAPTVVIQGTLAEDGREARLSAILGSNTVRNFHTIMKFDRTSGNYYIMQLNETETFTGSGSKTEFDLKWPIDLRTNTIEVFVGGELILNSGYNVENLTHTVNNATEQYGHIEFVDPPADGREIIINYRKAVELLSASDRINFFYNPTSGQYGKDLSQLMDGVDYGGVEVKSFEFGAPPGWDTDQWYQGAWDVFDEGFDDESFVHDGSTYSFQLAKPLQASTTYNVYVNNLRIDDAEWDGSTTVLANKNAIMAPIVGDGVTDTFTIDNVIGFEEFLENNNLTAGQGAMTSDIVITLRRSASDGSLEVDQTSYDTNISGGDLAYSTAKGINAEEIIIDGDGFVTPITSKGPEEVVPGHIADTLDITVYERPTGGASYIETVSYKGDGSSTEFDLRNRPYSEEAVIVRVDGSFLRGQDVYRIDYKNSKIVFYNAPAQDSDIVLTTLGVSGSNLLDYGEFHTDGSTQEFLTNVNWVENIQAYVTIDGKDAKYELLESDDTYAITGKALIKLTTPVPQDQIIQFAMFDSPVNVYSKIKIDEFNGDGSTLGFTLSQAPFNQQPASYYTMVTVNDDVLNAGYVETFTVQDGADFSLDFKLKLWQVPIGSIQANSIEVFLNGRQLEYLQEFSWLGSGANNPNIPVDDQLGSTLSINPGIANPGDEIKVYIVSDGDYRFGYFDADDVFVNTSGRTQAASLVAVVENGEITAVDIVNPGLGYSDGAEIFVAGNGNGASLFAVVNDIGQIIDVTISDAGSDYDSLTTLSIETPTSTSVIYFDKVYTENDKIRVYQFSNHDSLEIERENYTVLEKTKMTVGTEGYYDFRILKNSRIELQSTATSVDYVWIVKNNKLLVPTADYILLENRRYIELIDKLEDGDTIELINFSNEIINTKYAWRQFKDIMNKNIYYRLSNDKKGKLAKDLNWYDRSIELVDADNMPTPSPKEPGVIFIQGERLEYLQKDGNILKQLRRGTAGTGIKNIYSAGTELFNQNKDSIVPYKDKEDRFVAKAGTYVSMKNFYPEDSNLITFTGITYDFNNNTVFPLGTQVATVTGTGFRESVVIAMQNENGEVQLLDTTYVSPTELTFTTVAMPVGAYDMVILNQRETTPINREPTSIVVEKILPYVQVLIPFEPEAFTDVVKNPVQTGEWYKEPFDQGGIPQDYWEALDIEVFSNGRRLRKSPLTVYDQTLGQSSPAGDKQIEAEYAVNQNEGAYVRLTTPPESESLLVIVRKQGEIWNNVGEPLAKSSTQVASFLRGKPIDLPR